MTGFSGYRSGGMLVHTVVSGTVMLAAYFASDRLFSAPFWQSALAGVVCAILSWGIGRKLGEEHAALVPLAFVAMLGAFFYLPFAIGLGAAAILNGVLWFILPRITRDAAHIAQDALEDAADEIAAARQDGPARP